MTNNITQAAANKAAEEGGLCVTPWEDRTSLYHSEHLSQIERMDQEIKDWRDLYHSPRSICENTEGERDLPELPEEIEVGGEGWDFEDFKSQKTFSVDHMHEYARRAIAADRASRQVANKAEVEPVAYLYKWIGEGSDSYERRVVARSVAELKGEIDMYPDSWERIGPLYATPPATTGASTVLTDEQAERWAWEQVKLDVGTEGWTAGESCTYFGFFLWGWRYRAQYQRQRAAQLDGGQEGSV